MLGNGVQALNEILIVIAGLQSFDPRCTKMASSIALDLSTASGVESYLANTQFAATRVVPLAGGVGNFTFRLFLSTPHNGHRTVILKHAKPYVALSPDFPFSVDRQIYESRALEEVKKSGVCSDLVDVPAVIHHDKTANFLIIEDCGEQALTLKQLMLTATPTLETATRIGAALGEFLGRFHAWGQEQKDLLAFFDQNEQAKNITAIITYGRLIPMLTTRKVPAVELLSEPIPQEDLDAIQAIVDERTAQIHTAKTALTMGDFWTGNVLINMEPSSGEFLQANVIDWELAKPGIRALDVGQFCAEMHCVSIFHPEKANSADALIKAFLAEYRLHCGEMEDHLAGTAAKHIGAHLVTIAPTVGWGPPDESVKAVQEGLTYLWEGCSSKWLRERSMFAPLT
ncbi:APH domain-containing protein [Mycena indigotica]|uniref:APH domain-containing protein n=1 Tax=Mycena indigotica TaxID=2126181 RepID=A0A8H6WG71_9AGAR|nr:APH domain-containing protein [Mycena indigotica]KAF7316517.1 APH domain-containing protein [Mycena indigotica]